MRCYLDTNILVFLLTGQESELSYFLMQGLLDYTNSYHTSTICVQELIHLCQTGKLKGKQKDKHTAPDTIVKWLHDMGIIIEQVNERHLQLYSELPIMGDHTDPMDRLIIAQAISDRIPLASSDRKFTRYEKQGLQFVFNER